MKSTQGHYVPAHGDRCVCSECMRRKFPRTPAESLAEERARPQAAALNQVQRRHLAGIVKNWNESRELRGLPPLLADDALTQALSALETLIKEGLEAQKESSH